jgi:hypothetical protein
MFGLGKKKHHDGPVRVRPPEMGGTCVVRHPTSGHHVTPDPDRVYPANHALVVEFPWLFVSDADLLAAKQAGPVKSVRLDDLFGNHDALMREAIEASITAGKSRTPEEHAEAVLDDQLSALGYKYGEDENGAHVTFNVPFDPHQDEKLYRRGDMEWVSLVGLQSAFTVANASRAERAMALGRAGALTAAEREHLAYIADAAQPVDAVKPSTAPLTSRQARDILAAARNAPRPQTAPLMVPSKQIQEAYKPWE